MKVIFFLPRVLIIGIFYPNSIYITVYIYTNNGDHNPSACSVRIEPKYLTQIDLFNPYVTNTNISSLEIRVRGMLEVIYLSSL